MANKILKIGAKSSLKSTKVFTMYDASRFELGEMSNFQFIVQAIIAELQNNLTSKFNAHKLRFTFVPIFCFYRNVAEISIFSAF